MIYNNEFVWLHFPKTGGTSIDKIFRKHFSKEQDLFIDTQSPRRLKLGLETPVWHDSLLERKAKNSAFTWNGKTIICGIRRLDTWLQSRFSFEFKRSPGLPHNLEDILEGHFLERSGLQSSADRYMRKYLPPELFTTNEVKVIRQEHFGTDFRSCFSEFLNVAKITETELAKRHNFNSRDHEQLASYISAHRDEIYRSCPYWKEVEERYY
jgi:hypothetical protein